MSNSPVSLVKCPTYDEKLVLEAVRQAVLLLGGMQKFVKPGQRVLLKVNLLYSAAPEKAITTHPAVVKAVAHLVKEAGGQPVIGDSSGGPFRPNLLKGIYQRSGMARVAEETGAELNYDTAEQLVSHPQGKLCKAFEIGTYVTKADVVITLPRLKTHALMQMTGATKILFGAIPGTTKLAYHAKFPDVDNFADMLIDLLTLLSPALTIMDAVIGMDGEGPSGGDPFQIGAILASSDAVALDVAAAALVGGSPQHIPPLKAAIARGLASGKIADLDVRGETLANMVVKGFRFPAAATRATGGGFLRFLTPLAKNLLVAAPKANDACIGCGICAKSCPVSAITIVNKHAQMDLNTCIRCYCCHEMCPEQAIDLKKPWLGRVLG